MKHIKLFENIDLFQNWKDSEEYVTPNVSFVESEGIKYNPVNNNVIATFTIGKYNNPEGISICNNTNNISSMIIDGIVTDPVEEYDFNETGDHTVEFVLIDKTLMRGSIFSYCELLTSVTIPNSVTSIGSYAFNKCKLLKSVIIGNGVTSIGEYAFSDCYALNSITIPNSVTSIGGYAFYFCTGLKSITIPDSITSIDSGVFKSCSSLTSITIPNSVTSMGGFIFSGCTALTSITISNSVTSIYNCVFSGCTALKSITIPDSVTSIAFDAFNNCSSLSEIICLGTEPITVNGVFSNFPSNGVLKVPANSNTGLESKLPEGWTVEYI